MTAPSTSPPLPSTLIAGFFAPLPGRGVDVVARRELTEHTRALHLELHGPRIGRCGECTRLVTT